MSIWQYETRLPTLRDDDVNELSEPPLGGEPMLSGDFLDSPESSGSDLRVIVTQRLSGVNDAPDVPTTYHCHKHVVTIGPRASPFFRDMLSTSFREAQSDEVHLKLPAKQAEVFDHALEYMYHACINRWDVSKVDIHKVVPLCTLANYLRIDGLQRETFHRFKRTLNASTCLQYLILCAELQQSQWVAVCKKIAVKQFSKLDCSQLVALPRDLFTDLVQQTSLRINTPRMPCFHSDFQSQVVTEYIRSNGLTNDNSFCQCLCHTLKSVRPADAAYLLVAYRGTEVDNLDGRYKVFEQLCLNSIADAFALLSAQDLGSAVELLPSRLFQTLCERDDLNSTEDRVFRVVEHYANSTKHLSERELGHLWRTIRYGYLSKACLLDALQISSVPRDVVAEDMVLAMEGPPCLDSAMALSLPRCAVASPRKRQRQQTRVEGAGKRKRLDGFQRITFVDSVGESLAEVSHIESYRREGGKLWFQMPGLMVVCDNCSRVVPGNAGSLQGAGGRSQFAQHLFLCAECMSVL